MLASKFPPGFEYDKRGVQLGGTGCAGLPDFTEVSQIGAHIVSIREQYCPITNYDISGRASRGLFIGIPDDGVTVCSFLHCNGIYDVSMCTFSPERRSRVSRNCYQWGCEKRLNLTSYTLMDTLERWYSAHAFMTPIYLDLRYSNSELHVSVDESDAITIKGVELKSVLEKCFDARCPFVSLRIAKGHIDTVKQYGFQLRAFDVMALESADVGLYCRSDSIDRAGVPRPSDPNAEFGCLGVPGRGAPPYDHQPEAVQDDMGAWRRSQGADEAVDQEGVRFSREGREDVQHHRGEGKREMMQ